MGGIDVEFEGTWSLNSKGAIAYTAGDNAGETGYEHNENTLILFEDFVLAGNKKTTYKKKK